MKVAFFVGGLNRGGTEMLVLDVFINRYLAPFEPVLFYRNDGDLTNDYIKTGVPMFRIKPSRNLFHYVLVLRRLLRQERISILHAQTLTNAIIGIACTCFSHVKLVISFHGLFMSKQTRLNKQLALWNADAVIFVSNYVRSWYYNHSFLCPQSRSFVVYNGVDFSKLDIEYPEPDFLQSFERKQIPCLAMVGSFVAGRSQIVLCKALKLLKEKGERFHFFFIGRKSVQEPWLYDNCLEYCNKHQLLDCVHFIGNRKDVPAILQHIDGFVYSTCADTFGIAVVEAIASSLPTIVNDWDVMKEITQNGKLAYLFKTDDYEDCSMKMISLIRNLDEYKNKAVLNALQIRQVFSIKSHIDSLSKVYYDVFE